jgi:hypothetical protein
MEGLSCGIESLLFLVLLVGGTYIYTSSQSVLSTAIGL